MTASRLSRFDVLGALQESIERHAAANVVSFVPGKTYATRSICDHETIIRVTVAKRTAKTITTSEGKTLRVSIYNGVEQVKPWGSYSMAPIVGADDNRAL